jgi:hypothetical protein
MENPDKWFGRMVNLVSVFAHCCANDLGAGPFSLQDAWIWLSRITNMCFR